MAEVSLTCVSPGLKKVLEAESHHIEDARTRQIFQELLSSIPDCDGGRLLGLDVRDGRSSGGRAKRAPSAYNLFTAECMKGGERTMKECAADWRARKGAK